MEATVGLKASWVLPARPGSVGKSRHLVGRFAGAAGASDEVRQSIVLAVSETVTNSVVHAGAGDEVRVSCRIDEDGRFIIEIVDEGDGIAARPDSPGAGHGLAIVGALAQALDVASGPNGRGTVVTMAFGPVISPDQAPGLEALCALAVETVADASCMDLVRGGVLRRVAAQVTNEPGLSVWLREAVPPSKPGTATWAALRDGGVRLVVHDPSVPRSPGGPGERLSLTWWAAAALHEPGGTPAALWGFGGRDGGRSVPTEPIMHILSEAARGDLAQPAEQTLLRGQLATALR